jgi:hypothetical protein
MAVTGVKRISLSVAVIKATTIVKVGSIENGVYTLRSIAFSCAARVIVAVAGRWGYKDYGNQGLEITAVV